MRSAGPVLGILILAMISSSLSYGHDYSGWTTYTCMNWANDVLPDPDAVWVASLGGVYRFDLRDSTYTTYTNLNGLAGNSVLTIERDASGQLWFGTDGDGLSKWVEGQGIVATYSDFAGDRINALCAYGDKLFVGTGKNGISVFLPEREEIKENYRMLGRLPRNVEVFCVKVIEGRLWAGTAEGAAFADLNQPNLLDPESWTSRGIREVRTIVYDDSDSTVYMGTEWGIYRWKDGIWRSDGFSTGRVHDMTVQGTKILAGTVKGLFRRQEGIWKRDVSLSGEVFLVRSASVASASGLDALWLSAGGIGLTYVWEGRQQRVPPPPGPPGNKFMDLQVDPNGVLWAATSGRDEERSGMYRFDGKVWSQYRWSGKYASNAVVAVQVDRKGRVWAGTWGNGGMLIEDDGTPDVSSDRTHPITQDNTPLHPTVSETWVVVNDIAIDLWGNIWMCNYQAAESELPPPITPLVVINDFPASRRQWFTPSDDGLPTGEGTVVAADSSGLIWFGTRELGFALLDVGGTPFDKSDDHIVTFSTASHEKLTNDNISDIVVDREGTVWVATNDGVHAIRGTYSRTEGTFTVESWERYGRKEGLGSAIVHVVVVDAADNKWFGTEEGLSRLSALDGSIATYTRANSGLVDDGVRSLAFNARTGDLWIGTTKGLSKLEVPTGAAGGTLPEVIVFPNPLILSNGNPKITFADLPDDASVVRIFTLSGELVHVLSPDSGARTVTWDGGNADRSMVGSGVYFYIVTYAGGRHVAGKFAVVR